MRRDRESRPACATPAAPANISAAIKTSSIVTGGGPVLADLDALAEHLHGRFAVQVTVDDAEHRRTYLYRSAAAAERCVLRAKDRGRTSHVALVQLLPVGIVVGIGGAS